MPHREDNGRAGQSEGPAGSAQPRPGSCPRVCDGGGGAQVETLQDGVIRSLEDLMTEGDPGLGEAGVEFDEEKKVGGQADRVAGSLIILSAMSSCCFLPGG